MTVQHGSHGAHAPGGGDGQSFSQGAMPGQGHGGHNFLSHLLGLDHHAHHGGLHSAHAPGGNQPMPVHHLPSQSAGWSSALQSVKLSDALQGINVTPNFLFILLFAGFIAWLFVIYWVRHHEPLANSVLGTAAAHSATAAADRKLIDGTKIALPGRTCEEMGDIYVPTPGVPAANAAQASTGTPIVPVTPLPAPPVPPAPAPEPQPTPLATYQALPLTGTYAQSFGQPAARAAFMVPEPESGGTRVKMIVNR